MCRCWPASMRASSWPARVICLPLLSIPNLPTTVASIVTSSRWCAILSTKKVTRREGCRRVGEQSWWTSISSVEHSLHCWMAATEAESIFGDDVLAGYGKLHHQHSSFFRFRAYVVKFLNHQSVVTSVITTNTRLQRLLDEVLEV